MAQKTSTDLNLYGYTRQAADMRQPAALATLLHEMLTQQFLIIGAGERATRRAWMRARVTGIPTGPLPVELQTPTISPAASAAIQQFDGGQTDKVSLMLLSLATNSPQAGLYFTLDVDAAEGTLQATTDEQCFIHDGQPDSAQYIYWLTVLQRLYTLWHPILAFTVDDEGDFLTTQAQALQHRPAYLYDVNFFGPEIVASLGRERFVDLPAWQNIALDDGGILLVPAPYASPDAPSGYEVIADRLGLGKQDFVNAPGTRTVLDALGAQADRLRAQRQANQSPPTP